MGDVTASHVRASVYRNVDSTGGSTPNLLFEWNVNDPGTFEQALPSARRTLRYFQSLNLA